MSLRCSVLVQSRSISSARCARANRRSRSARSYRPLLRPCVVVLLLFCSLPLSSPTGVRGRPAPEPSFLRSTPNLLGFLPRKTMASPPLSSKSRFRIRRGDFCTVSTPLALPECFGPSVLLASASNPASSSGDIPSSASTTSSSPGDITLPFLSTPPPEMVISASTTCSANSIAFLVTMRMRSAWL